MYKIMGKYQNAPMEEIDEADSYREAKTLLREYQMAFGEGWSLWLKRPGK